MKVKNQTETSARNSELGDSPRGPRARGTRGSTDANIALAKEKTTELSKSRDARAEISANDRRNGEPPESRDCFVLHNRATNLFCPAEVTDSIPPDEEFQQKLFLENWDWAVSEVRRYQGIDVELVASCAMDIALRRYDPLRGATFRTFLTILIRQQIAEAYRRQAKRLTHEQPLSEGVDVPDKSIEREVYLRELREELVGAISRLSPSDQNFLKLCIVDGLSYAEIKARYPSLTIPACKSRKYRITMKLYVDLFPRLKTAVAGD